MILSEVDTALKAAWHAWVISCESDPCLTLDCAVSWLERPAGASLGRLFLEGLQISKSGSIFQRMLWFLTTVWGTAG